MRTILKRLDENRINIYQCFRCSNPRISWARNKLTGVTLTKEEVDSIKQYSKPSSLKQLGSSLGLFKFDGRFVPGCAQLMRPLTEFLKGKVKEFMFAYEAVEASKQPRDNRPQASTLMYPNSLSLFALMVDALDKAVDGTFKHLSISPANQLLFSQKSISDTCRKAGTL